ncbi:COX assembly mitochondrial protein homolog [Lytechinus variegatus]|uniref:COX assembly mitochondrial protein homolog n=1 Tax=Lytechinus variegatus TaxID=7654 RepID=UPI001BB1F60B|nr:COX assembly mitochondrial protein homolog [Lytechinus variegatus]
MAEGRRGFAWQEDEEFLRKVEVEVLIPKKMREKAKVRCSEYVDEFTRCCKEKGLTMAFSCRKENRALKDCISGYYQDKEFFEMCKKEYLAERKEFRETGVRQKDKQKAKTETSR